MTTTEPSLLMVAGPNGSGKSTLIAALRNSRAALPELYVNADDLQRELGIDAYAAQKLAAEQRARALRAGQSFMYETVMSHPSKLAELQAAALRGYRLTVYFIATINPALNVARIQTRVASGGHDVPEDKARQRYHRTLALAPLALAYAHETLLFDNSSELQLHASLSGGHCSHLTTHPPAWMRTLVTQYETRHTNRASLVELAVRRGISIVEADLTHGHYRGPITLSTSHFIAQEHGSRSTWILHERQLFELAVDVGQSYAVDYGDFGTGICQVSLASEETEIDPSG
jgi:predicted ABC-type ATPase